jgi:hypothetical protein
MNATEYKTALATMTTNTIKTTTEGSQFISERFESLKTVEQWIAAFPARYAKLPAKIARAFATRDMPKTA